MADIHVHIIDGKESVYPEERIPELLQQGALTPDTYYWREGMTKWRPLSTFKPAVQAVVPERRTDPLPYLADRPIRVPRDLPEITERGSGNTRRFRFRRNPHLITRVVQLFLIVLFLLTCWELACAVLSLDSSEAHSRSDFRHLLGWVGLGLNLIFLIPYCQWVYRTTLNCGHFASTVIFRPKWAVGCHFVPVMNLVRPFQVWQELWRVSDNPRGWQNDRFSVLVSLWWAFLFLTLALAETAYLMTDQARTPAELRNALLVVIGLKAVQSIWYILFFAMVTLVLQKQIRLVNPPATRPAR